VCQVVFLPKALETARKGTYSYRGVVEGACLTALFQMTLGTPFVLATLPPSCSILNNKGKFVIY